MVGSVVAVLSACGGDSSGNGEVELVIAGTLPANTAMIQGADRVAEQVAQDSDGSLTVEVYPDGQLGGEPEMLEALSTGTVDVAMVGAPLIATHCPSLGMTSLPYVVQGDTPEEQYANLQRIVETEQHADAIEECAAAAGFRVIDDSWWYGNRELTSNIAIRTPEDLAGLRVRTPEGALHSEPFAALGAEPVPMAQSEVYTALETGVIDAQENPFATTFKHAFYEVQSYLSLTGLMTHNQVIVMSEERFSSLSAEQQEALSTAVSDAGAWQSEQQMAENAELRDTLESEGMEVIEPDLDAFRAATEEFVQAYFDEHGLDLDALRSVQQ